MSDDIKHIQFKKGEGTKSFFDLIALSDILALKPSDHSQFEHHRLTFFLLMLVEDGSGTHSINFQDYNYEPGTVFAIGPDNIHRFHQSKASGNLLVFTDAFLLQYLSQSSASKIVRLFNEQLASPKQQLSPEHFSRIRSYIDSIRREMRQSRDEFSAEVIRSLLHLITTELLRIKAADNQVFGQTKYLEQFLQFQELVKQHGEVQHRVSFYADKICITPRTLNNITHSIVHKSAKAVIDDILLRKIKRLLLNSHLSVTQIAHETGFIEASHLFKFFKKHTGLSPKKFRDQLT